MTKLGPCEAFQKTIMDWKCFVENVDSASHWPVQKWLTLLGKDKDSDQRCQQIVTKLLRTYTKYRFFYPPEIPLFTRNTELGIKTKYN